MIENQSTITPTTPPSLEGLFSSAPLLRAYIECSEELQSHAKNMVKAMFDPELDDDDRFFAATTLLEILFPYHNESDNIYGMDLLHAEQIVKNHPYPEGHPIAQECGETAAIRDAMGKQEATFATRLQTIMDERQLTQTALAELIGVSQPAIALMLKRECRPQKRTIKKIAKALGLNPNDLWPQYDDNE